MDVSPGSRSPSHRSDSSSNSAPSQPSPSKKRPLEPAQAPQGEPINKIGPTSSDSTPGSPAKSSKKSAAASPTGRDADVDVGPGRSPGSQSQRGSSGAGDPLAPVAEYDWKGFVAQCEAELNQVEVEENHLMEEYRKWNWLYEIWATFRSQSDNIRLSREMATIVNWTQLKETEVERARIQHTEDMRKISSVLGLPSNFSYPAGK